MPISVSVTPAAGKKASGRHSHPKCPCACMEQNKSADECCNKEHEQHLTSCGLVACVGAISKITAQVHSIGNNDKSSVGQEAAAQQLTSGWLTEAPFEEEEDSPSEEVDASCHPRQYIGNIVHHRDSVAPVRCCTTHNKTSANLSWSQLDSCQCFTPPPSFNHGLANAPCKLLSVIGCRCTALYGCTLKL